MKSFYILIFVCLLITKVSDAQTKIPKQISGGIVNGKAISLPKPVYPIEAKNEFANGKVNVQVTIDETGNIISAKAVSGHPLLLKVSEEAALKAKFSPTILSGKPVKVSGIIVYKFISTEMEKPFWAFSMFLTIIEFIEPDLILAIGNPQEFEDILLEMSKDLPVEFETQKELFIKLKNSKDKERSQTASELRQAIKSQLKGHELWQIELGERFGLVLYELLKIKQNWKGKKWKINEVALKTNLQQIQELCQVPPKEISKDFVEKFKAAGEFANEPNIIEKADLLFQAIEPIFESLPN